MGFEIGLAGQILAGFGLTCAPQSNDVVSCADGGPLAWGLLTTPRLTIADVWAVGLTGQVGWANSIGGGRSMLWGFGVEGRWRPWARQSFSPWLGADVGALVMADTPNEYVRRGARTYNTWASATGLVVGLDGDLGATFAFTLELRGLYLGFASTDGSLTQPYYQSAFAAQLAVGGAFRER